MAVEFHRVITLLRKERGITQKQAANDLGISQAQLSHYEKGIRECSLDFVVTIADYYHVSCDYLLGRSADRNGSTIQLEELPGTGGGGKYRGSVLPTMYKKLIENSIDILYDKMENCKDKNIVVSVSNFLMLAVYRMFRELYQSSPKNISSLFRVGNARWQSGSTAAMSIAEGNLAVALNGESGTQELLDPAVLSMSTESLGREYPRHATSLFNLIKNAEEAMRNPEISE